MIDDDSDVSQVKSQHEQRAAALEKTRCRGENTGGERCSRMLKNGKQYCKSHADQAAPQTPASMISSRGPIAPKVPSPNALSTGSQQTPASSPAPSESIQSAEGNHTSSVDTGSWTNVSQNHNPSVEKTSDQETHAVTQACARTLASLTATEHLDQPISDSNQNHHDSPHQNPRGTDGEIPDTRGDANDPPDLVRTLASRTSADTSREKDNTVDSSQNLLDPRNQTHPPETLDPPHETETGDPRHYPSQSSIPGRTPVRNDIIHHGQQHPQQTCVSPQQQAKQEKDTPQQQPSKDQCIDTNEHKDGVTFQTKPERSNSSLLLKIRAFNVLNIDTFIQIYGEKGIAEVKPYVKEEQPITRNLFKNEFSNTIKSQLEDAFVKEEKPKHLYRTLRADIIGQRDFRVSSAQSEYNVHVSKDEKQESGSEEANKAKKEDTADIAEALAPLITSTKSAKPDWKLISDEQLPKVTQAELAQDQKSKLLTLKSFNTAFRNVLETVVNNGNELHIKIDRIVNARITKWQAVSEHTRTRPVISSDDIGTYTFPDAEQTLSRQLKAKLHGRIPDDIYESADDDKQQTPAQALAQIVLDIRIALSPANNDSISQLEGVLREGPKWFEAASATDINQITRQFKNIARELELKQACSVPLIVPGVLKQWENVRPT